MGDKEATRKSYIAASRTSVTMVAGALTLGASPLAAYAVGLGAGITYDSLLTRRSPISNTQAQI
jgi:hypothetical protein